MMRSLLRRSSVLAVLLAAPAAASAQTVEDAYPIGAATTGDVEIEPLPVDSAVTIGTLPNGLRYYIRTNEEPARRAELRLVVKAGSLQEDDDQLGYAHFLEHMAFNGTENFEEHELVDYLESIGMRFGADLNASTGFDHTLYRLTVPTDTAGALETAFRILDDWARGVALEEDEVEAERGVVLSEWRGRLGAGARVRARTDSLMYGESRYLERRPIGMPESIENATRDALARFYEDWYRPDLMAVVVVGEIDEARVESLVREHFGDVPAADEAREPGEYDVPAHDAVRATVVTDPELTGSTVELVRKYEPAPINSVERRRDGIVQSIFASILNDRLRDIATGSDSPFLNARTRFSGYVGGMSAHTVVSARVGDDELVDGFRAALSEVERIARHGITARELEREKRSLRSRYTQALITRSEISSASRANSYVTHFVRGRTPASVEASVALSRALLEEVTADQVAELAGRWKSRENLVLVATLPEKDGVVPPTVDELRAVLDQVEATTLAAEPDDGGGRRALIASPPAPGAVVDEDFVPEVGVTEWTLANGARVLLKPTDHSPDQILFTAYAWGGTSVVADEDLHHAALARTLPGVTGIGEFSSSELRNAVVGKLVSVGMNIGSYTQSVSGRSTRRDLETFLQLAHLHFTAARLDEDAIESWKHRTRTTIEGRSANPETHFSDTLRTVMTQAHPRRRSLTFADLDSIDPERALEIYRDRFADAGSFTFVIVGDFEPDSIRPLVETYIGGLPDEPGDDGWRDTGVRAPTGVVEKEFRFGRVPRARIGIVFNGPFTHTVDDQIALRAMASVLDSRLRDRLREELGGTYSVHVHAQVRSIPEPTYQMRIIFDAGADRTDVMADAVFDEVERFRRDGPTDDEVAEVREEYARQLEQSLEDNGFWLRMIRSYDQMDRSLERLADYGDMFDDLDADAIHKMARQYLDPNRHVRVTRLPRE